MIKRFIKVTDELYRGGEPSIEDISKLQQLFNINKIISLDGSIGKKIDRVCKLQEINHIIIPINGTELEPIAKLLSYNLRDLLISDGPTFVHCAEGKDRTGMVIAMFKCKYLGWSCQEALKEAEKLGFGIGLDQKITNLFRKIVCKCCQEKHDHAHMRHIDNNNADIIENMRNDQMDHDINMPSFAPYLDFQAKNVSPYENGPGLQGFEAIQFGKGFVAI